MDRVVQHVVAQDLTGGEIKEMMQGRAYVKTYQDLEGATVESFFGSTLKVALLFPVSSLSNGHWLAVWLDPVRRVIHHFDSYGLSPDAEDQYSKNPLVQQRLLNKFYAACVQQGYSMVYNQEKYQQWSTGVNTCGRHVITRLRLSYLSEGQYARLMLRQRSSPDEIVTLLTFLALNEDQKDSAEIRKILT